MNIRRSYQWFAFGFGLFCVFLGLVVFRMLRIQDDIVASERHRFRSFQLALDLFQSSEDLTRMARSYVSTGNPVYEQRYQEILDIRNGRRPRPSKYPVTYWHLAGEGRWRAVAPGEAVALRELMRREGFTEEELGLLGESQDISDRLVAMEKQAFAAVQGLHDDGRGNFTAPGAPDRDAAVALLFSQKYSGEKARIMAPIQRCMEAIDARTRAALSANQFLLRHYIVLALVLILLALLGVEIKVVFAFRGILRPIERLAGRVTEIASGNYAARCDVAGSNEVGRLCGLFNAMAGVLEQDIAQRKQAEAALAASNEHWMQILEKLPFGVVLINRNRTIRWANQTACRLAGMTTPEALQGRPCGEYLCPAQQHECPILDRGQSLDNSERLLRRRDGTTIPILKTVIETQLQGEAVLLEAFIDITARKRAEAALAQERQRLAYILEGTHVGTWEWNVQTGAATFNERWAEIIGYSLAELEPVSIQTWIQFAHPDDLARSNALLERHFKGELPAYECESRMRHKDGSWIWVLDRGKVATRAPDGQPLVVSGTHQDITVRKQAEERLDYLERIFLHDIMNTAVALRGFAELAASGAVDRETEKKMLPSVAFLSGRIIDEIEAHRQLMAAEQKQLVVKREAVNSLSFLAALYAAYRRPDVLEDRELGIDGAAQSVDFTSDKTLLGRVVGNMIKNAIEASRPGEKITLGCFARDQRVHFWVHNPAFIPEEIRAQLFNRSFSTKGAGRGLGTYSMKLLTEQYLQGRLSVMSTENEGTTFTVDYPLA